MRTRRASPRDNHHAWGSGRDDSLSAWTFAGDRALRERQGGDHRRVPPGAVRLRPARRGNATHQRTRAASADVRGGVVSSLEWRRRRACERARPRANPQHSSGRQRAGRPRKAKRRPRHRGPGEPLGRRRAARGPQPARAAPSRLARDASCFLRAPHTARATPPFRSRGTRRDERDPSAAALAPHLPRLPPRAAALGLALDRRPQVLGQKAMIATDNMYPNTARIFSKVPSRWRAGEL